MRIDIGDMKLFFDVDGESLAADGTEMRKKPTLLLLHGGPGFDHSGFKPYFSRFADHAQVIYLDQRGMGRSDRGDMSQWTLDQWASDVKSFCEALEIEKPIVLGHSFGGFVATKYAATFPGHPSKLIISSSLARVDPDTSVQWFRELGGDHAAQLYRYVFIERDFNLMDDFLNEVYPLYNTTPQDPHAAVRMVRNPVAAEHFFTGESIGMDLRADVPNITCPTLVLAGDRDPMTPVSTANEFAGLLTAARSKTETVENAGHGVWKDQPQKTEELLREFINAN